MSVSSWQIGCFALEEVPFLMRKQLFVRFLLCDCISLNDTIKIKRKRLYWYFTHLHPLIWIFKQFRCPKWFWQKNLTKSWSLGTILILTQFLEDACKVAWIIPHTCALFLFPLFRPYVVAKFYIIMTVWWSYVMFTYLTDSPCI